MTGRPPRDFVVYGFDTTHQALDAERVLLDSGVAVVPIPTPRVLGSGCGIAMRIEPGDEAAARHALVAAGIAVLATAVIQDV